MRRWGAGSLDPRHSGGSTGVSGATSYAPVVKPVVSAIAPVVRPVTATVAPAAQSIFSAAVAAAAPVLRPGASAVGSVSSLPATTVASLAAKAGVTAYVFYPNRLEATKARACRALGAKVCQVEGNYDEANRQCRAVAAMSGLEFANITLRPFYAEGAKTVAYEIVEQLGWEAPQHIVTAAAGGGSVPLPVSQASTEL